jgi:hypothetical protein
MMKKKWDFQVKSIKNKLKFYAKDVQCAACYTLHFWISAIRAEWSQIAYSCCLVADVESYHGDIFQNLFTQTYRFLQDALIRLSNQ